MRFRIVYKFSKSVVHFLLALLSGSEIHVTRANIQTQTFTMAFLHAGRAGQQSSRILTWRFRPFITTFGPVQQRFAHSEDRAPYEKHENVGTKSFGQFDVGGKVFVVTGIGNRTPHSDRIGSSLQA